MIQWGLISKVDADCIMNTLDLIMKDTPPHKVICTSEVGIFNGQTSRAINEYIKSKGYDNTHTAIDSHKDFPTQKPFEGCIFLEGNSNEVYNTIPDQSQDFIFIDGCHAFPMVVSDFFCYAPKVKPGGYLAFHDTAPQAQGKDWQRIGSKDDPDMYISVRKALRKIGLIDNPYVDIKQWELKFEYADRNDEAGGICVFKKTK